MLSVSDTDTEIIVQLITKLLTEAHRHLKRSVKPYRTARFICHRAAR